MSIPITAFFDIFLQGPKIQERNLATYRRITLLYIPDCQVQSEACPSERRRKTVVPRGEGSNIQDQLSYGQDPEHNVAIHTAFRFGLWG